MVAKVIPLFKNLKPTGLQYAREFDRMKAALRKIAEMPYDDKEMEERDIYGKRQYYWLSGRESSEYLCDAVEIAYRALCGKD